MGHIFAATLPFADFIYYDKTRNYVQIYARLTITIGKTKNLSHKKFLK